jgi:ribosomal protein S27E
MKTKIVVAALAFLFGTTTASFAGNHSALTYPTGGYATVGAAVSNPGNLPGKVGPLAYKYPAGVMVASAGNSVCPVMNHRITSKHNATVVLSNGKYMQVCCPSCKQTVDKDLGKYKTFLF